MNIVELEQRLDTVYSICCQAIMSQERYRDILNDEKKFSIIFPNINFQNPKITFTIDNFGEIYSTTKNEITNEHNHNLFKGWQIVYGIMSMTSVLEFYLWSVTEEIIKKPCKRHGILYKFTKLTNIEIEKFDNYDNLNKYYQVRHIAVHNLSIIDDKFNKQTKSSVPIGTPYMYYPQDLFYYKDLILSISKFIENKIKRF